MFVDFNEEDNEPLIHWRTSLEEEILNVYNMKLSLVRSKMGDDHFERGLEERSEQMCKELFKDAHLKWE